MIVSLQDQTAHFDERNLNENERQMAKVLILALIVASASAQIQIIDVPVAPSVDAVPIVEEVTVSEKCREMH